MSTQGTLFELEAADRAFSAVPACMVCGARGPSIQEDPKTGGFNGAVLFAIVAIKAHMREMHPEREDPR